MNLYNDVWVLENADGTGGAPRWVQLQPKGARFPATHAHAAAYDSKSNRLVLFGGIMGGASSRLFVLSNANGLGGVAKWREIAYPGIAPAGRLAPLSFYDTSVDRLLVLGGQDANSMLTDGWLIANTRLLK